MTSSRDGDSSDGSLERDEEDLLQSLLFAVGAEPVLDGRQRRLAEQLLDAAHVRHRLVHPAERTHTRKSRRAS